MGPRPAHLKLNDEDVSQPLQPPSRKQFQMDLPSPRTGEAPPALSPLDAFAMQSRILAQRFEKQAQNGRRISRLPHTDVAREFANRPDYFRSVSSGSEGGMSDVPEVQEESPTGLQQQGGFTLNEEKQRPKSHYPLFGNVGKPEQEVRRLETPIETPSEYMDVQEQPPGQHDYFGIAAPRATSPEPVDPRTINIQAASPLTMPSLTNSVDSVQSLQPRTLTNGSTKSQPSLAPPRSPAYPKSPRSFQSIRSVPPDSGDEDGSVSGSHALSSRKLSGSSGVSRPQSPFSPFMPPLHRSPSMTSEYSVTSTQQRRNFSRPMSSGSNRPPPEPRPSFDSRSSFETRESTDLPHRHPSAASGSTHPSSGLPSRQTSQDDTTPASANAQTGPNNQPSADYDDERPTTSYVHRKYALPRGRNVERTSRGLRESWIHSQFTWDSDAPLELQPLAQRDRADSDGAALVPPPPRMASPATSERIPQERQERLGRSRAMSSANRSRSVEPRTVEKTIALHKSSPSIKTHNTDSTERTVKAVPLHERAPSAELTADEHLEIGIQAHTNNELNKSTYHLRLAAQQGLATGMLLYALACRHGWGMRPNQEEGVRWLRKAIEGSGLEVADVEQTLSSASRTPKADPVAEAQERKKRKMQFALAIYELGTSYMNGWGCPKDKPLAVRCYEVAGSWGDCDALTEAGFCYTQGQGCKKDLRKAAALYRKAAEGGMSMAGNSWIYKPKYMEEVTKSPEKDNEATKPAGRSRARSIWSRNKKDKP